MTSKAPAVAGQFYPEDPKALRKAIKDALAKAEPTDQKPKAIIAPHAGYQYSSTIAASAYAVLKTMKKQIRRVVLLGPAHFVGFPGVAIPTYGSFTTPLGEIKLDRETLDEIKFYNRVWEADQAFTKEHSLEVHLPFLQELLDDFELVPLLVGPSTPDEIGSLICKLWGGEETLIVVSSDLSHYLTYDQAYQFDINTNAAISMMHEEKIPDKAACGRFPIRGLIYAAKRLGLCVRPLDLRNSGDTVGNKSRVVGYAAYHFYEPNEQAALYSLQQKRLLLQIARESIKTKLETGETIRLRKDGKIPFDGSIARPTFVTINSDHKLRGCKGSLQTNLPVHADVARNAYLAAFEDERFKPLTEEEFKNIELHISILSPLEKLKFENEQSLVEQIHPGIDGLILKDKEHTGTFLPIVWLHFSDPEKFLKQLKIKAGLPDDYWSDDLECYRFFVADQVDDELFSMRNA